MKQAKQQAGDRIVDLTISNPVEAEFDYPHRRLKEIFASVSGFSYRPDPLGQAGARSAICSHYYSRHNVTIDPRWLALTASTSEAYSILFKLLCDPGDEILVPTPSYPLFDDLAALESVRAVPYRLLYAGNWFIDFEHLQNALSRRTRAIILVNPNNPTGSFLKQGEYALLRELASRRSLPLICDEVFMDYPINPAADIVPTLIGNEAGLGFSLGGLSKSAGMPQLKLGWIAIHGEGKERATAAARLEHILDTYLSVGTPVQSVLPDLLSAGFDVQRQIKHRIQTNFTTLVALLETSPVHPLHLEGGWSVILQLPATRSEEHWVTTLLRDYSVAVQPGYFFDIASEAHIVISLLTPPNKLKLGIEKLLAMIEKN